MGARRTLRPFSDIDRAPSVPVRVEPDPHHTHILLGKKIMRETGKQDKRGATGCSPEGPGQGCDGGCRDCVGRPRGPLCRTYIHARTRRPSWQQSTGRAPRGRAGVSQALEPGWCGQVPTEAWGEGVRGPPRGLHRSEQAASVIQGERAARRAPTPESKQEMTLGWTGPRMVVAVQESGHIQVRWCQQKKPPAWLTVDAGMEATQESRMAPGYSP